MKVTLESTTKIVELTMNGQTLPARIWEGTTESGIKCHAYITRVAVSQADDATAFERDLVACRAPSPDVDWIPARMIL